MDNAVLKGIKAYLWSGNGLVILEFADKKDESKKGKKDAEKQNNSVI